MAFVSTSGRAFVAGIAKQSLVGTAVPPTSSSAATVWPRWLNGSKVKPQSRVQQFNEGDGGAYQSLNLKTGQWGMGKFITKPRPIEAGYLVAALAGPGSDHVTGSGAPYTHHIYRVAASVIDHYTLGANIGAAHYKQTADAVCSQLVISASRELATMQFDADWLGLTNSTSGTPATTAQETGKPFGYFAGTWGLPVTALNGAVKGFTVTINNSITPEDWITEQITPNAMGAGLTIVTGSLDVDWQDGGAAAKAYFNDGSADSATLPTGAFSVQFASLTDPTLTATLLIPGVSFDDVDYTPDETGTAPMPETLTFHGVVGGSNNASYEFTVLNSQAAAYN